MDNLNPNDLHGAIPVTHGPPRIFVRFQQFFQTESAGGLLLMVATVLALIWANSPLAEDYHELWHTYLSIGIPGTALVLNLTIHHWINDCLMVAFFFVIGLEIKREMLVGELSQLKQAMLPIFGAIGGMLVPALIYVSLNWGQDSLHGWGVPVATDIAFALAILALLGRCVPLGLKVFLVALAIVDDLGAVLVIALFYTESINMPAIAVAVVGLLVSAGINKAGVSRALPYACIGLIVWLAVLLSGIHATIAGILMALTIPARGKIRLRDFWQFCQDSLSRLEDTVNPEPGEQPIPKGERRLTHGQTDIISGLEVACRRVQPPLDRLEHSMLPWIAFAVIPLFAIANAGVTLPDNVTGALASPVSLGIILGLTLGKQLGVTAFVWLAVRLGIAELPAGVNWMMIYGAAWICGVGFTMSLFIAHLAFGVSPMLDSAKMGVLSASMVAGVIGYFVLKKACKNPPAALDAAAAPQAHQAA